MIFIRADANEKIGTGHVMRCLSLAKALADENEKTMFITADHKADGLLKGFRSICLNSDWNDMDSEIANLLRVIKEMKPLLLLVDSYYVTKKYFDILSKEVRIAYMDDMNKGCWKVHFLINYNIYADEFDYSVYDKMGCKRLLMPKYAPLRREFINMPRHDIKRNVTDILISAGGTDPENITEKIIEEVCPHWMNIKFHFVIGNLNPRVAELKRRIKENIVFHVNETNMSALMIKCDIALSAAGSTLYELCACGTPTITFTLADNQKIAAEKFAREGLMLYAGDCRNNERFIPSLMECMKKLILNQKNRETASGTMQRLLDGNGAARIVRELLCEVKCHVSPGD